MVSSCALPCDQPPSEPRRRSDRPRTGRSRTPPLRRGRSWPGSRPRTRRRPPRSSTRYQRRVYGLALTIVGDHAGGGGRRPGGDGPRLAPRRHLRRPAGARRQLAPEHHPQRRHRRHPQAPGGRGRRPTRCWTSPRPHGPGPGRRRRARTTTSNGCTTRSPDLPEEQCRAVVLAGRVGPQRRGDRRTGRDPARHRQDPDPHRAPTVARRARRARPRPDRGRRRGRDADDR